MLVYKYRGGNEEIFERDLSSLEKNYFWSSDLESLNDPQENLISTDKFSKQSNWLNRLFGNKSESNLMKVNESLENLLSHNKRIGIYSLSKSPTINLLWAHYANCHKGFCIEYDLDKLLNNYVYERKYSFPVIYSLNPSELDIKDISNASKNDRLIQKLFACKSKIWEYENEHRIITDDFGIHNYDFVAVKSIYFGLKMLSSQKEELMNRLKGRGIKFYEIIQLEKKYTLNVVPVKNHECSELSYLKQMPLEVTNNKLIKYDIFEKFYIKISRKAEIRVELETTITEEEIRWLSNFFSENLFRNAERIYIYYYLKSQEREGCAWATSHIIHERMEISINKFSLL